MVVMFVFDLDLWRCISFSRMLIWFVEVMMMEFFVGLIYWGKWWSKLDSCLVVIRYWVIFVDIVIFLFLIGYSSFVLSFLVIFCIYKI